jgi:inhibitor of KinA
VEFEERIDPAVNARVIRLAAALRSAAIAGVRDVVPTYRSVAVYFDPVRTQGDDLVRRLEREASDLPRTSAERRAPIQVPVCYGGEFGPDLADVANQARMTLDEVIALHSRGVYRVYMLGFLPGFAYMGLVDPKIATPRRATPRVRVSKGSVGIAGRQTGIYPSDTPGGWQLLGRTPSEPFNISRPSPFLFEAGDSVRFVPVDRSEYERLCQSA